MDTFDLRRLDLNLVVALHALLEERNVSAAARRLGVSQPAASQSLAKLRRHFGDELLTRVGGRYELTPLGAGLAPRVDAVVNDLAAVLGGGSFDAANSEREFKVAMSDYAALVLGGPLLRRFAAQAPRAVLRLPPLPLPHHFEDGLLQLDAFVAPRSVEPPGESVPLFSDEWCCVVDRARAEEARSWTCEEAQRQPWVTTEIHGIVPGLEFLRRAGVEITVGATVQTFTAVPYLVAGTHCAGLVQRRLAERLAHASGTVVVEMPWTMPAAHLVAFYERVRSQDPAVRWLLDLLVQAGGDVAGQHRQGPF